MRNKPADIPYCGVRKKVIKRANPVLSEKNLLRLYNFITRRYKVHYRKDVLGEAPPWTKDSVIADFRFTNVRREHDKETKWVIEHITSNPALSYEDKLLNVFLFRVYNRHETAELIGMPIAFSKWIRWDAEPYRELFEEALEENPKRLFFTAAFKTSGVKGCFKRTTGEPCVHMAVLKFMEILNKSDFVNFINRCKSPVEIMEVLTRIKGIGEFLAYQIFVDMAYIPEFPFSENEFTVAGPGCKRGLNCLFEDKDGMTHEECLFWLRDNIDDLFINKLGKPWNPDKLFKDLPAYDRKMNVMSLENCFCELSKYIRAKEGTGHPRQKYHGR